MDDVLLEVGYFPVAAIASFFTGWFAVEGRVPFIVALLCAPLVGMALVPSVAIEVYGLLSVGRFGAGAIFLLTGTVIVVLAFPWILVIGPMISASICCLGYYTRHDLFPMDTEAKETAKRIRRQRRQMANLNKTGSIRRNRKS
ncbi:hypothetical protein [Ruegeria sp. 6PALISEP08]|uniref:hypothetical protein n=1 Tax=Ruegeria sp. 6PALISEP08 TaxID=1225660 RepID=UPI00067F3381|nr:hypothetical protein [Ruegeria sp. 6PALISEP08]